AALRGRRRAGAARRRAGAGGATAGAAQGANWWERGASRPPPRRPRPDRETVGETSSFARLIPRDDDQRRARGARRKINRFSAISASSAVAFSQKSIFAPSWNCRAVPTMLVI